jgi:hypothetical protein
MRALPVNFNKLYYLLNSTSLINLIQYWVYCDGVQVSRVEIRCERVIFSVIVFCFFFFFLCVTFIILFVSYYIEQITCIQYVFAFISQQL